MSKPLIFSGAESDKARLPLRVRERLGADYIPGYSEIVMANDLDSSTVLSTEVKQKYFKRDFGTGPATLPVEFKWIPVAGPFGETSYNANEAVYQHKQLGYEPVILRAREREAATEEFKDRFYGFGFPPAAHISSDGMIRHRDAALFFVDRETADRLEKERIQENKRFLGHNQPDTDANIPQPYDIMEKEDWVEEVRQQNTN